MKTTSRSFAAAVSIMLAIPAFSNVGASARDANPTPGRLLAAQTPKQQCVNACRARYRDCLRLNQIPSFECRGVYQDCTRYSCTGLGPG